MRALLLTLSLFVISANAYSKAPVDPIALFKLQNKQPIEFVTQTTTLCSNMSEFKLHEQEQANNDLMMGVMLAAKESGMQIELVEEDPCTRR